jgi:hypothetical protein
MSRITESELQKVYSDTESRLKSLETHIEQLIEDLDKIEIAFMEGDLSMDQFIENIRRKQDELGHAVADKRPFQRALYLIREKIKETK